MTQIQILNGNSFYEFQYNYYRKVFVFTVFCSTVEGDKITSNNKCFEFYINNVQLKVSKPKNHYSTK